VSGVTDVTTGRTTSPTASPWLPFGAPPTTAPRLFCFPNAGAGAARFAGWRRLAAQGVAVCPVQPPGRAERFREPAYDRLEPLVDDLLAALDGQFTGMYALFGHSVGALVAYELARRLCEFEARPPAHLYISARPAPQLPDTRRPLRDLPAAELFGEIRRIGGTPDEVLRDPELTAYLLPLLRADFAVNETYRYQRELPLDIPLTVFGGERDPRADEAELLAWRSRTTNRFDIRVYPGGHFYLDDRPEELVDVMTRPLLG